MNKAKLLELIREQAVMAYRVGITLGLCLNCGHYAGRVHRHAQGETCEHCKRRAVHSSDAIVHMGGS